MEKRMSVQTIAQELQATGHLHSHKSNEEIGTDVNFHLGKFRFKKWIANLYLTKLNLENFEQE